MEIARVCHIHGICVRNDELRRINLYVIIKLIMAVFTNSGARGRVFGDTRYLSRHVHTRRKTEADHFVKHGDGVEFAQQREAGEISYFFSRVAPHALFRAWRLKRFPRLATRIANEGFLHNKTVYANKLSYTVASSVSLSREPIQPQACALAELAC